MPWRFALCGTDIELLMEVVLSACLVHKRHVVCVFFIFTNTRFVLPPDFHSEQVTGDNVNVNG